MSKINFKEAQELNQNFVKTRTKSIDIAIGKKDAISSWFSLEEIKNYISYVEEQAKLKDLNVNGLRVYFGAYSNSINNVSKKGLATVFFVPTQAKIKSDIDGGDENSDIIDIDALNDGQVGDPPSAEYPQ
ncbi:hypothetical protein [Lutibacter maritimus]|uniref:Uncharacterized protein n=1 Tax=Lutibacter maritimus TaxID=593133 RepID=A0A1I6PLE4_9FLAO|nr:hypothetical protein [Lutibacter maritimus]SFS41014.1 hypothetical protein SAMN04488006_1161 [Lutibacter maritimus]